MSTVRKFSIKQSGEFIKATEEKIQSAQKRALLAAGYRLTNHIVNVTIPAEPRMPVDRGIYRGGWRVRRVPKEVAVLVYNVAPHAGIIEEGVPANNVKISKAMIDALTSWVLRKGIVKKTRSKKSKIEARQVAWAIAQSMRQKGIFQQAPQGILGSFLSKLGFRGKGGLRILAKAARNAPHFIAEELRREMKRFKL